MPKTIIVKCGLCQYFTKNQNHEKSGICSEWETKKKQCDSPKELSVFFNHILGGTELLPELPRVCEHFSGNYVFYIEADYVD